MFRRAEPDTANRFHPARQSAIIDDLAANGRDTADPLEGPPANQHAAAGSRGDSPRRVGRPARRIQLEKKEDEGWDDQSFPDAAAIQPHH